MDEKQKSEVRKSKPFKVTPFGRMSVEICGTCEGRGKQNEVFTCVTCDGTGKIIREVIGELKLYKTTVLSNG